MYCLSFHLNFLKTPLVSSNSSYLSRASEINPGFCGVLSWCLIVSFLSFDLRILITPLVSTNSSYPSSVVFCRSLFLVFFCPLYCLFFDLWILITSLVSSNSSYPSRASELNPGFCGIHGA